MLLQLFVDQHNEFIQSDSMGIITTDRSDVTYARLLHVAAGIFLRRRSGATMLCRPAESARLIGRIWSLRVQNKHTTS